LFEDISLRLPFPNKKLSFHLGRQSYPVTVLVDRNSVNLLFGNLE
jgi:hypothetical protein